MRYGSLLLELSARPVYLLLVLAALIAISHFIFIRAFPLTEVQWKKVDYVWIGAAACGILVSSANAERYVAPRFLDTEELRLQSSYNFLRSYFKTGGGPGAHVCQEHVKGPYSPNNFEDIERERAEICRQFATLGNAMPKSIPERLPALSELGYTGLRSSKYFRQVVADIENIAADYSRSRERCLELREASQMSGLEEVWLVLGPLLVAVAFALRLTKVTAEVRSTRRKAGA